MRSFYMPRRRSRGLPLVAVAALSGITYSSDDWKPAREAREEGHLSRDTPRGRAIAGALEWLARHQSSNGSWDADGFSHRCAASPHCEGPGGSERDLGVTGLALLALLEGGNTHKEGPHKEAVLNGLRWLRGEQDRETGLLGSSAKHDSLYHHTIATYALCEAFARTRSSVVKANAQLAVKYVESARNPYGAWRYDVPPNGDNDTSVTGWAILALRAAKDAGLEVDGAAFEGAARWIEEVSDPATGRVGYDTLGSLSSRSPANEHYGRDRAETLTAVGLLTRFLLGQEPEWNARMVQHADVVFGILPEWNPDAFACDMYYWYYGTRAMARMGGERWKLWREAMHVTAIESQRAEGDERGSWDPVGPWGWAGGRVYSTAMMSLALAVEGT